MKSKLRLIVLIVASPIYLSAADPLPSVDFVSQIKPILANACVNCHNSESLFGNLNLENRDRAFQQRKEGPAIIPGLPDQSPLYQTLVLPPKEKKSMPALGHKIDKKDIALIRRWIFEGAKWPTGADGVIPPPPKQKPSGA